MAIDDKKTNRALTTALSKSPGGLSPDEILQFDYSQFMDPQQKSVYNAMRVSSSSPALPELNYGTMFPSGQQPIQKGQFSGPNIGSYSTYAPNMLVPFGVFDARKKALENAAAVKAKAIDDFFQLAKPPKTTRFAVQGQLDQLFFDGLQKAIPILQKRYGNNWASMAKNDPQFLAWQQSVNTIAQYEDGIVEHIGKLQAMDMNENFVLSPQTKQLTQDFMMGVDGLSNPYNPQGHQLADRLLQSGASADLDVVVNDAVQKFADKEYTVATGKTPQGPYDAWTVVNQTGMTPEQVEAITDGIWMTEYGGQDDFITRDIIKQRVQTIFPERQKKSMQFQNAEYSQNASGADFQYTDADMAKEPGLINVNEAQEGGAPVLSNATTYSGITFKKPIKASVPQGTQMYDPETGSPVVSVGQEDILFGESVVARTVRSDDGKSMVLVTDSQYEKMSPTQKSKVKYEVVVAGKQSETGRTVVVPAANVENALVKKRAKDGSVELGVPVDKQQKVADDMNKQQPKPAAQSQPATNKAAPYGPSVVQNGVTYVWNGQKYVAQ